MTLFECYEKRKGALYARLTQAKGLGEGAAALADALDAVLYDFSNGCDSDEVRELAAGMTSAVKTSFPLLECASETKIWRRAESGEAAKAKKWPAVLCLVFGLATLFLTVYIFFAQRPDLRVEDSTGWAAALSTGLTLLFVSGLLFKRSPKAAAGEKEELQAQVRLNAEDAARRLAATFLQMDKNLDLRRASLAAKAADERMKGMSADELELMAALLEGAYSEGGELALESLGEVGHYLRRKGFELRDYDGRDESCFELLPGERQATLRPALLMEGRLIKKGLATYGGEGAR